LEIPALQDIATNGGQEGERVAKRALLSNGFEVSDFSRLRGNRYDLWARDREMGAAFDVEAKSGIGTLGSVGSTRPGLDAAESYPDNFVFVLKIVITQRIPELNLTARESFR